MSCPPLAAWQQRNMTLKGTPSLNHRSWKRAHHRLAINSEAVTSYRGTKKSVHLLTLGRKRFCMGPGAISIIMHLFWPTWGSLLAYSMMPFWNTVVGLPITQSVGRGIYCSSSSFVLENCSSIWQQFWWYPQGTEFLSHAGVLHVQHQALAIFG